MMYSCVNLKDIAINYLLVKLWIKASLISIFEPLTK